MENKNYKVLVVEDDPGCLRIDGIILKQAGFKVTTAVDGLDGWEKFQNNIYHLVVVDRMMPLMTGDELVKKIRAKSRLIPIIMTTALSDQNSREEGIEMGANQYIGKGNEDFDRELAAWAKSLAKDYYKNLLLIKQAKENAREYRQNITRVTEQMKKIKMSHFNNDKFISFEMACASWEGNYNDLSQTLVDSITALDFQEWKTLKVALLLKVNDHTIRINVEENSEDEKILETVFDKFFFEIDLEDDPSMVRVIWSVPWETREIGEGISFLINNFPKDVSADDDDGFGMQEESIGEIIQGSTYRFLDYMARVIGNFEIHRKFKELVFSASENLNKVIEEIDENRQKQITIFESIFSDISNSESLKLDEEEIKILENILNEKLDAFTHLEMNSMNDIQRLLKLVRKLQSQFEKSGVEGLSDDADASQIGGNQQDVEDLLAQFDM